MRKRLKKKLYLKRVVAIYEAIWGDLTRNWVAWARQRDSLAEQCAKDWAPYVVEERDGD